MAYYPTTDDLMALNFTEKIWYVKIVLLNDKFQHVHEMKHEFINGSLSTNVDSDIRHTFNMTLGVVDKNVGIEEDKLLWIDKFVKVYIGVNIPYFDNEIKWYDKGIFVMTDYNYNQQSSTLSINCSDLVCFLNGDVGGSIDVLELKIEADEYVSIREAIIHTIQDLTPFTKYYVTDMPKLIPHDLEFGATDTVWSVLTTLRDLYPGYEMFFDVDGTFICQEVSTTDDDPVVLDNNILQQLYISETDNGVLKDIRNINKVWGKCLDADYYTTSCTYDSTTNTYTAHFVGLPINDDNTLTTSTKFAIKMPNVNTADGSKLIIYNRPTEEGTDTLIGTFDITDSEENKISKDFFIKDAGFVFRYRRKTLYVLGEYQIFAVNVLRNTEPTTEENAAYIEKYGTKDISYTIIPDSPFSVEKIGERVGVYQGGEYEDIESIHDCLTRAEYETYYAARVVTTISLEMVFIPWLQGNEKIQFQQSSDNKIKNWIVQSISSEHPNGVMTLTLTEFFPLYNFEIEE